MEAGSSVLVGAPARAEPCLALVPPPAPPEPCTPAELRALVHAGETDSDACERLLAQLARVEGALEAELEDRGEAQMRAARVLRARVPVRIALLLQAAFRAVRAAEGRLLDDGRCLVRVARHFVDTWKPHVKKARTLSQRTVHAHHIVPRSRGGSDAPENPIALCACHHLRGIHGGHMRVRGQAPDRLLWEVGGSVWRDGDFGARSAEARAA